MERPPMRRDLMDFRLRRGQDSRTSSRHSHVNHNFDEAPRLPKRQDTPGTSTTPRTTQRQLSSSGLGVTTSPTSPSSIRARLSSGDLQTLRSSIMSHSDATGTSTRVQNETVPVAQLILSAALIKSTSIGAGASTGATTTASVPGTSQGSTLTATPSTAQPNSQSLSSSGSAPAQVSAAEVANAPSTAKPDASSAAPSSSSSSSSSPSSLSSSTQPAESSNTASSLSSNSRTSGSSTGSSSPSSTPPSSSSSTSADSSGAVFAAGMSSQTPSTTPVLSSVNGSPSATSAETSSLSALANPSSGETLSSPPSSSTAAASLAPGATEAFGLGGSSASSSTSQTPNESNSGDNVPDPTVVGSVIGGLAGISIILVILLFVFRRFKRKRKSTGLPRSAPDDFGASRSIDPPHGGPYGQPSDGGGATRDLDHDETAPASPILPQMTEQRGFERISGRKLPSQFSPGMQGPSGAAHYPSGSSYYPTSSHYMSGATASSAALVEDPFADSPFADPVSPRSPSSPILSGGLEPHRRTLGDFAPIQSGQERYHPGPGRIPVVHQAPNLSVARLSAPATSPLLTSAAPDSRSSRFQEEFV